MTTAPEGEIGQAEAAGRLVGVDVSRETCVRLAGFVALLRRWNQSKNLVSPASMSDVWRRHVADSLQVLRHTGAANVFVDLGSGAGLPGLVIAAALADRSGAHVHCVESRVGKAAFLREAARSLGLPVTVHAERVEDVVPGWTGPVDVVTARALAPVTDLVTFSLPLLKKGALGLFLKGQDVGAELTQAATYWKVDCDLVPSLTDPRGSLLRIRQAEPIRNNQAEPKGG